MFRAGIAPLLVFTGGRGMPWQPDDVPDGELLAGRAVASGIPITAISVTSAVGNIEGEAEAIAAMF